MAVILHYAKEFAILHTHDFSGWQSNYSHWGTTSSSIYWSQGTQPISGYWQLRALDHDFHIAGIVPSVVFFSHIFEARDSFLSGPVYVTLKDKVLQPSHALWHATELSKIVKSKFSIQATRLVIVTSDGGPDHRLTYLSVKVALIALFDVDMPNLSLLKLEQYGRESHVNSQLNVSLARQEMDAEAATQDNLISTAWSNWKVTFPWCMLWPIESSDCSPCWEI